MAKCIFKNNQERNARFPKDACYCCKDFIFNDGLGTCKQMNEKNLKKKEDKK